MKMGTKSLLFGAHQILWHPFTVFLAWCELYGLPNWKECVCIFIHDWGYWGCENMEGTEGANHPTWAGSWAQQHLDRGHRHDDGSLYYGKYCELCAFHSRTYIKMIYEKNYPEMYAKIKPSKLCWADKLCVLYDPWWLYLPRVLLTGEWKEYREEAARSGVFPMDKSMREWYEWARERMIRKAYAQDARPPYTEGS